MIYTISAIRSDGCYCEGTVQELNEQSAMKTCRRTFRKFTAKSGIAGCIHSNEKSNISFHTQYCRLHIGEVFTFSNHSVKEMK